MRSPTARAPTWPRMTTPSAVACDIASSVLRHWSGRPLAWATDIDTGRPLRAPIALASANSWSKSTRSLMIWITPLPAAPRASAMPIISSSSACSVGVYSPVDARWFSERDEVNPMAPASTARRAISAICAMSSGVAGSRATPRSPMTLTRTAAWGS